jgi:hypothetical protein
MDFTFHKGIALFSSRLLLSIKRTYACLFHFIESDFKQIVIMKNLRFKIVYEGTFNQDTVSM